MCLPVILTNILDDYLLLRKLDEDRKNILGDYLLLRNYYYYL